MKTNRRGMRLVLAVVGLGLTVTTGCQTWVPEAGLTLPTGHYLRHTPQYIPPSPDYPLSRELATLEEAAARQNQLAPAPFGP